MADATKPAAPQAAPEPPAETFYKIVAEDGVGFWGKGATVTAAQLEKAADHPGGKSIADLLAAKAIVPAQGKLMRLS